MTAIAIVLVLAAFVAGCIYQPIPPFGQPRTWRGSAWIPVGASLAVLGAVAILGAHMIGGSAA